MQQKSFIFFLNEIDQASWQQLVHQQNDKIFACAEYNNLIMSGQARRSSHETRDDQHVSAQSPNAGHSSQAPQSGHAASQRTTWPSHSARFLCLAMALDACHAIHVPSEFQGSLGRYHVHGPLLCGHVEGDTMRHGQHCHGLNWPRRGLETVLRGGNAHTEADKKGKDKPKPSVPMHAQKQKKKSFPVRQVSTL